MATLGATFFDLIDLYNRQEGPDQQIATIIEMLMETNGVLDDAIAMECNNGTKHIHTIRTGLPPVTWGQLYKGIPQGKSTTAQVEDVTGFVEALSSVDKRLLRLSSNEAAVRLSEAVSFIEAMNNEVATGIFYHNQATDPERFTGFSPRFGDKSASNGNQIIDALGVGADNTSIWFVTWGDQQCHLLYPKGTTAGLSREDKGEQRVLDGSSNAYYVMEEEFRWDIGLAVKDWRYVARIANIDVSLALAGSVDLFGFMRNAYYALQSRRVAGGRMSIYLNTNMLEVLDMLGYNQGASDNFTRLRPLEIQGREVLTYRGIPLRETDAIINTEAQVT